MQNAKKISEKVPPIKDLEGRFHFIGNDTLRQNVALEFQYIIFLIAVLDEAGAEGSSIASSTHKDMITHTACVVEACTHYALSEYIRAGKVVSHEVMPKEEKYVDPKLLYKISSDERLMLVREVKRVEKLHPKTQLKSLNEAALASGIYDQDMFAKAEALRILRNKMHLPGLDAVDSSYDETVSNRAFELAKIILNRIEEKLQEVASADQ